MNLHPNRLRKLTPKKVEKCIAMYQSGSSLADIAGVVGIARQNVWEILRRRIKLRPQRRYGKGSHLYNGGPTWDKKTHSETYSAIRNGTIINPGKCSECGVLDAIPPNERTIIHAHHDDYNHPLRVRWLCGPCHKAWHRTHRAIARRG